MLPKEDMQATFLPDYEPLIEGTQSLASYF